VAPTGREEDGAVGHHVVAGLLVKDGRVLLCHRSPGRRWYPDLWDLAGGHVEEGELREEALGRELAEELGIVLSPPIVGPVAVLSDPELSLAIYVVTNWVGDPVNRDPEEHDEIGWFEVDEVRQLRLALPALPGIIDEALALG
jgi:8-oxo-dGTP diphosphatase